MIKEKLAFNIDLNNALKLRFDETEIKYNNVNVELNQTRNELSKIQYNILNNE